MVEQSHRLGVAVVIVITAMIGLLANQMGMAMDSLLGPPGAVLIVFALLMYGLGSFVERKKQDQN